MPWTKTSKACATQAGLDHSVLQACFNGAESAELQKKFAALTPKNHQYTPWVLINGKQWQSHGKHTFLSAVCKAYKGSKPAGCSKVALLDAEASSSNQTALALDLFNNATSADN